MPRLRSQSQSVSLFPFLAVLVCAMGALILLLIVTTRRIRKEALVKAAVETPVKAKPPQRPPAPPSIALPLPPLPSVPAVNPVQPTVPPLPALPKPGNDTDRSVAAHIARTRKLQADRESEFAWLQSQQTAAKKKLKQLRSAITLAQRKLTAARLKLKTAEANAARLAGARKDDRTAAAKFKQQALDLAGRIAALRSEIVKLKEQQAQTSSRFAIVPFDGNRGTTRRPIYIECTQDSLRILPEDITIRAADLQHFGPDYNPLLAGTRALVKFWDARNRLDGDGKEPSPYVLLLIRPKGTMAYYAARKMLRGLKTQSGYELIESDWQIDLPKPHPKAKAVCRLAVDRALAARNQTLRDIASNRKGVGSGTSGRNMRFNRATGRFEEIRPDRHLTGNSRKAFRGGFGQIVRLPDSTRGAVRRPPGGSTAAIRPKVTELKPGRGTGKRGNGQGRSGDKQPVAKLPGGHHSTQQPANSNNTTGTPITPRQRANHPLWPLTGDRKTPRPGATALKGNTSGDPGEQWRQSQAGNAKRGDSSGQPSGRYVGSDTKGGGAGPNNLNGFSKATVGGGDGRGTASNSQTFRRLRWGLSDPDATIGFEKDVPIWCAADRIVVGPRQVIPVGKVESHDKLFRMVVFALEAEARSWGKPPKGFYWVPAPKFVISPGGNRHFGRINGGLKKLGLESEALYRLGTTPPAWVKGAANGP